ncbi:MAG: glycosyltransferase family 39 protein [Terracidiphilus sp.]
MASEQTPAFKRRIFASTLSWQECKRLARAAYTRAALPYWSVFLALVAGAALRLFFVVFYPNYDGDSGVYGMIAKNILVHHQYALDNPYHLTLIRLPGYPLFLALIFKLFGMNNYDPARPIQLVVDLVSCLLIFGFVRDQASRRAAHWALWLAVLCPFTANYVATPMTETISIFCVALGLFAGGRVIAGIRAEDRIPWGYVTLTAAALSCAILFRPDGGLLSAAIVPCLWWYARRVRPSDAWTSTSLRAALVCSLLVSLPLIAWTIRNYRAYHVFQPLAPRYCTDPGESTLPGYVRWTKTWLVELVSSGEVYWKGDSEAIDMQWLPSRAFDSPEEQEQTRQLIEDYNQLKTITPEIDARFESLAEQRIRRHPLRFYLALPLARVADMWLRPRTELLSDPSAIEWFKGTVPLRWWEWRENPLGSLVAVAYGIANAALLALAAIGFARRRVPFAAMLGAYLLLRSLLLATIENAEPRYTLEAFPIVLIAAAVALAPRAKVEDQLG